MNSKERHERRYQRRKAKRRDKEYQATISHAKFKDAFNWRDMAIGMLDSRKAIWWKASASSYLSKSFYSIGKELNNLRNNTWKPYGFYYFYLMERGKLRYISAPKFPEKVVQRTFCDNVIIPLLKRPLIYDNAATIKGKGTEFLIKRFKKQLRHHIQTYGLTGYIFFFDFHDYFKSIPHYILKQNASKYIHDKYMREFYNKLIDSFDGEYGLGLGSQVSQISAVFYPNELDHIIKDKFGITGYGRYNDDGYIICEDLDKLKVIINEFYSCILRLSITPNKNKCKTIKITSNFRFLKRRFFVSDTGKIVVRWNEKSISKERYRLRKYKELYKLGLLTFKHIELMFHSWLCTIASCNSFHIIQNIVSYFNHLFYGIGSYIVRKPKHRYQNKRYRLIAYAVKTSKPYERR